MQPDFNLCWAVAGSEKPSQEGQVDPPGVARAEISVRKVDVPAPNRLPEPAGVKTLHECERQVSAPAAAQRRGAKLSCFKCHPNATDSVAAEQLADTAVQAGQELDVLVSVEVRRLMTVIQDALDLPHSVQREQLPRAIFAGGANAEKENRSHKAPVLIEQLAGVFAAGQRSPLCEIQMHAQVERLK